MMGRKRFCKSLVQAWVLANSTWESLLIPPTRIICHRSSFHLQLVTQFIIKSVICLLFVFLFIMICAVTMENYTSTNPLPPTFVLDKQQFILPNYDMSFEALGKQKGYFPSITKYDAQREGAETIMGIGKIWIRISNEVFVYSAHLDIRNSSTYFNNSSSGRGASGGWVSEGLSHASINSDIPNNNVHVNDSDKLKYFIVRIVGIKTVPPLREFIKGDILDWFRIKNEMEFSHKFQCKLFVNGKNGLESKSATKVTYTVIEEGIKVYAGCYINCYFNWDSLSKKSVAKNLQVALYPKNVPDFPTKLIDVSSLMTSVVGHDHDHPDSINYHEGSLAACVQPLFGPFDDLTKIVQFISYYHSVGVTQFTFYSMSISTPVRKYFRKLSMLQATAADDTPRVILHDWNLPTGNTSELWDYGSLAALNDCLLSNIDQEFVLFVDIDEFIVPQRESDSTLWDVINLHNKTKTYQLLIRNTFFCNEFCELGTIDNKTEANYDNNNDDDDDDKQITSSKETIKSPASVPGSRRNRVNDKKLVELPIFQCTQRTKRIWNVALRSKYIVNPRQVLAVGHHLVTKYVNKMTDFRFTGYSIPVDPKVAVMNHYRECTSISSKKHPVLTRIKEEDRKIMKFKDKVLAIAEKYFLARDSLVQ